MDNRSATDDEAWVPCDLCNTLVRFQDYVDHTGECIMRHPPAQDDTDTDTDTAITTDTVSTTDTASTTANDPPPTLVAILITQRVLNDYDALSRLTEAMGTVEIGMTDLDGHMRSVAAEELEGDPGIMCPVCQDPITKVESSVVALKACDHWFCDSCIRRWLSRSTRCPVCMMDLRDAAMPAAPSPYPPPAATAATTVTAVTASSITSPSDG